MYDTWVLFVILMAGIALLPLLIASGLSIFFVFMDWRENRRLKRMGWLDE